MKKILLLSSFFLFSCRSIDLNHFNVENDISHTLSKVHLSMFSSENIVIDKEKKLRAVHDLCLTIREITEIEDCHIILEHDLLGLIDSAGKENDPCLAARLTFSLNESITRKNFNKLISNLNKSLKQKDYDKQHAYRVINRNIEHKMAYYNFLLTKVNFNLNNSNLKELIDLLDQQSIKNNFSAKIERFSSVSKIINSLPISNPFPNSKVTRNYGNRINPLTGEEELFEGVNFTGSVNSNIYAAGEGRVIYTGAYKDYGYTIIIDHGLNIKSLYAHLQYPFLVKLGDKVDSMQPIALQGKSGNSVSDYLNFQIQVNDKPINPHIFLDAGVMCDRAQEG